MKNKNTLHYKRERCCQKEIPLFHGPSLHIAFFCQEPEIAWVPTLFLTEAIAKDKRENADSDRVCLWKSTRLLMAKPLFFIAENTRMLRNRNIGNQIEDWCQHGTKNTISGAKTLILSKYQI